MKKEIKDFLKQKKKEFISENYNHVWWLEFESKDDWKIIDIDELDDIFSDFIIDLI